MGGAWSSYTDRKAAGSNLRQGEGGWGGEAVTGSGQLQHHGVHELGEGWATVTAQRQGAEPQQPWTKVRVAPARWSQLIALGSFTSWGILMTGLQQLNRECKRPVGELKGYGLCSWASRQLRGGPKKEVGH